jgi:flagellar export protein FliJ
MSVFHFRLDALLRVRRTLVRNEEMKLARLVGHRTQLTNRLTAVERSADACSDATQRAALHGTTGAELAAGTMALAAYREHANRLQAELRRLAPVVEQQRARYLAAHRAQEKVDKLREAAYSAWRQERSRSEQQAADELYLLRRHIPKTMA